MKRSSVCCEGAAQQRFGAWLNGIFRGNNYEVIKD